MALERQRTDERLLFHTQLVYLRYDYGVDRVNYGSGWQI